ncbi:MAG: DUF1697 domain-containing protein [Bacteroidales bacterium]|jgi:uncharacterized protein (DUF1697 family)|nr:DUF1697 domain-containing protein [Bacteroidales bacterium]
MTTRIALLRSVNVLGKNMIKMPELALAFEKAGFRNVRTYIQSGNILFETDEESADLLSAKIRELISKKFGLTIQAVVLAPQELADIIAQNPFVKKAGIDLSKQHVTFLDRDTDPEKAEKLLSYHYPPDEIIIGSRAVYVHCPDGYGRTKYHNNFIEKKLEANGTSRNWNTCLKLLEMCSETGENLKTI